MVWMLNLLYDYRRMAVDLAARTRQAIMAVCGVVGKKKDKVCSEWLSGIHRLDE